MNASLPLMVGLLAASGTPTALAADVELSTPSPLVEVAPGASADVVFTMRNDSDDPSTPLGLHALADPQSSYVYSLVDAPGCGPLEVTTGASARFDLAVASIPAHTARSCTLHVFRSATAIDNAFDAWQLDAPTAGEVILQLGSFVDLELTGELVSREVSAAGVHSIIRLIANNVGPLPVVPAVGMDLCFSSATLDSGLPQGCPIEPGVCGVNDFEPWLLDFPTLAVGATADCLVGLTVSPWDTGGVAAYLARLVNPGTGGQMGTSAAVGGQAVLPTAVPPVPLDQAGLSGSWANPGTPGQGIVMSVQPDYYGPGQALLFGGWFTYDSSSTGEPRWYTIQAPLDGTSATVPIYLTRGGRLDSAQPTLTTPAGSATLRFADCTHGELAYTIGVTATSVPRTGTIPLTRLLSNVGCATSGAAPVPPASYALGGIWADPGNQGQGLVVDIDTVQGALFAGWYTYTTDVGVDGIAGQRWYTLQSTLAADAREADDVTIYESGGGRFDSDRAVSTVPVGNGAFILHTCSSATLSYRFTSGPATGHSGSLELTRLGAAPPGCTLEP